MLALLLLLALSWSALAGALLLLLRRRGRRAEPAADPATFGALPWGRSSGARAEPAPRLASDVRREPAGSYNGSNGSHAASGAADAHALCSGIFAALYGNVVALDAKGIIVAVNRSWVEFARANGADPDRVSVGADFTTKAEGLGMGLSISRSIVHAYGGRIWATSNEDRGTTVVIELPSTRRGVHQ